ncbi:hypothetical protein CMO93_00445 [Candidatus Woesearchaeota archaeon]|nr:hypothetical protein [Candidatus Woesearchaeota archaeon]
MFKRSQAALEFLTTYAWAFLIILIMIGALAYFGILNPSKILPDRCTFGTEISCVDYRITAPGTDTFSLRLKNSIGEPIIIPAIVASGITLSSESATAYACTLSTIDGSTPDEGADYTWNTADVVDFAFTDCTPSAAGFVQGDKGKVLITINYHLAKSSATYKREVSGEVFATIT